MSKHKSRPNYEKLYPDIDSRIIDCLKQSDQKIEYMEYGLKEARKKKSKNGKEIWLPSREVSIEEFDGFLRDQEAEINPEVLALRFLAISELRRCLELLPPNEKDLIFRHYYMGITQTQLAKELSVTQQHISKILKNICDKLGKMMNF